MKTTACFPRNPARDKNGQAVLYPGRVSYEGDAALFTDGSGNEFVVMAPNIASLDSVVKAYKIHDNGEPVDAGKCAHARLEPTTPKQETP